MKTKVTPSREYLHCYIQNINTVHVNQLYTCTNGRSYLVWECFSMFPWHVVLLSWSCDENPCSKLRSCQRIQMRLTKHSCHKIETPKKRRVWQVTLSSPSSTDASLSCDLLTVPVLVGGKRERSMNSAERPFVLRGSHILWGVHSQTEWWEHSSTREQTSPLTVNDDRKNI